MREKKFKNKFGKNNNSHTEHKFKVFDKKDGLNKWKWRVIWIVQTSLSWKCYSNQIRDDMMDQCCRLDG
jgi:hypothetical protein